MLPMPRSDRQVAIRLPRELVEDIKRCAKRSRWSFAAQVRYELMERRGMIRDPYLPQPTNDEPPAGNQ